MTEHEKQKELEESNQALGRLVMHTTIASNRIRATRRLRQLGATTLYQTQPMEHLSFARHLTPDVKTEEFVSGKVLLTKWERLRRNNYWLDALYNACAAGHLCGVRRRVVTRTRPNQSVGRAS